MIKFKQDILSKQREVKTANQYVSCVGNFLRETGIEKIEDLDKNDYLEYHDDLTLFSSHLIQERQLSSHTVNVYFNALENFFDFLVYFRHIRVNPIPFYRKRCLNVYKEEEPEQAYVPKVKEMAEFVETIDDPHIRGAVVMGSKCMLRLTEMLKQRENNVSLKNKSAIVHKHKKRSNTVVFFDDETEDVLKKMISTRSNITPYLFLQQSGNPYSHETFRRHLQKYAVDFGIYDPNGPRQYNLTYISFRRFGVTQLMKTNIPPTYISFMRGDKIKKSKDIKEIYFDIDLEDVQEKYEKYIFKLGI